MSNARKYLLTIDSVISCGLGSLRSSGITYSLLDSFTINYDTGNETDSSGIYTYPAITILELEEMPAYAYVNRVIDFLNYLNIEDSVLKEFLLNTSTFTDESCDIICGLNSDFLVYKFLDGVRIINAGTANGTLEYRLYPTTDDPNSYDWQISPTFLGLNSMGVYVAEIRDILNGVVQCEYNKEISMPLLVSLTSHDIREIIVGIEELTNGKTGNKCYNTGLISVDPILSSGEKIKIDYIANTLLSGKGSSSFVLKCKANGSSSFKTHTCFTNTNGISPRSGSFTLYCGDVMCYNETTVASNSGSFAESNFVINNITGLGTTIPIIDITRCEKSIPSTCSAITTLVSVFEDINEVPTPFLGISSGRFLFNSPIPVGECVVMNLNAGAFSDNGTASITFSCKPSGGANYLPICTIGNEVQQTPTLTVKYGDELCWYSTVETNTPGSTSSACFNISNINSSIGVYPIINSGSSYSFLSIEQPATEAVVYLCNNIEYPISTTTMGTTGGVISIAPTLCVGQSVVVNYAATLCSTTISGSSITTSLNLYCKPNNGSCFLPLITTNNTCSGIVSINHGDSICYNMCVDIINPSTDYGFGKLELNSVVGSGGVIAVLSETLNSDTIFKGMAHC